MCDIPKDTFELNGKNANKEAVTDSLTKTSVEEWCALELKIFGARK